MIKLLITHKIFEHAIEMFFNKVTMNFNKSTISIQCCALNDSHLGMKIVGIDPRNKCDSYNSFVLDHIIGYTITKCFSSYYGSYYMAEYKHGTGTGNALHPDLIIILESK